MGLRSEIQADIEESLLDDLADATSHIVLIKKIKSSDIDPLNGYSTIEKKYDCDTAVFSDYNQLERDGINIKQGDVSLFMLQNKLGCTPEARDTVAAKDEGKRYDVISVEQDAARVGWTLQLRESVQ